MLNLDQFISELLFEHDCVIIPGFGGIVTSYRSSFLNPAHHTFSPPSKKLAFNASLRNNDGLLANHIGNRLSISYQEANNHINVFVEGCMTTLKDGKKLLIERIGELYLDDEHNLQFIADTNVNYLKTSFGLYPIHSPAVKRIEHRQDSVVFKPARRKKTKPVQRSLAWRIIEVIPVAALLVLLVLNPNVIRRLNQQAASINPFYGPNASSLQHSKDSLTLIANKNSLAVSETKKTNKFDLPPISEAEMNRKTAFDLPERKSDEAPARKEAPVIILKSETDIPSEHEKAAEIIDKHEIPVQVVAPTIKSTTKLYYVIGGCFGVYENAVNFRDQMIAEGFQSAIIGQSEKGLHMVSLYSSPDNKLAANELALIKEKAETNAWMFRK